MIDATLEEYQPNPNLMDIHVSHVGIGGVPNGDLLRIGSAQMTHSGQVFSVNIDPNLYEDYGVTWPNADKFLSKRYFC